MYALRKRVWVACKLLCAICQHYLSLLTIVEEVRCPNGTVKCDHGYCIPYSSICNSVNDCTHGEDENHCPYEGINNINYFRI